MNIRKIGYAWPEPKNFKVFRPAGIQEYNFIHFYNSFKLTLNGEEIITEPHACIIFKPGTPQFYSCSETSTQDWFRITGDIDSLMEEYGLSYNTVYYPRNNELISSIIRKLELEYTSQEKHFEDVCKTYFTQLIIFLSRETSIDDNKLGINAQTRVQLINLRRQIQREYNKKWTIGEMAKSINLSTSYLHATYKRFFNISPLDDLISIRMEHACEMLSVSQKSVNEIAECLGYNNPSHFIRQFAQKKGMSPAKYRLQAEIRNSSRDRAYSL